MAGYSDPELLLTRWLKDKLDLKTWCDPELPENWNFTAPIGHIQRGQDIADSPLSLDFALLDISWYAAKADHARQAADRCRNAMRLELPLTTFSNGVFVRSVQTIMAPSWILNPRHCRRAAAYRVELHGFV